MDLHETFYRAAKKKEGALGASAVILLQAARMIGSRNPVLKVMFDDQGIVPGHTFSTSVAGVRD
jgi:hypothetical protein